MQYKDLQTFTQAFYTPKEVETPTVRAQLFVISGPLNGNNFSTEPVTTTIGRLRENSICIPVRGISKTHCKITKEADSHYYLVDLNSKNGTIVNGRRAEPDRKILLTHGDTILICDTRFFFLNPQSLSEAGSTEEIKIDFDSAAREAGEILDECIDIIALRKSRKRSQQ